MAIHPLVFRNFEGGQSTDLKSGIKNSFAYSLGLDFRKSPSQMTHLPGFSREDSIVNDLVQNEVMVGDGTTYSVGSAGGFYKRTPGGTWSREAGLSAGCYGLSYRPDTDSIYIPTNKSVSWYQNVMGVNGTVKMNLDYYGLSYSTYDNSKNATFNVAAFTDKTSSTYALSTSIKEDATNRRYFQSDIEPLNKISVFIVARGTGNWTLTLHDGLDNVLGTKTVSNASLTNGVFNDFAFTAATNSQVRIYVAPNARTYHIHITSTVADGTAAVATTNDFSTASLQVWADRLVQPKNGMHPMDRFQQYEVIGNGNYLSVWEPISNPPSNTEWKRHKLTFPQQYEVCGIAVLNEFVAIACEQTTSTGIAQNGVIFFWDGIADTYNYFVKIPEGAPYGIHEYQNVVYFYAGGSWYAITSASNQPVKIRTLPSTDTEYSGASVPITVYPYTSTVRRGTHLSAFPSTTTSTAINYGIYSWGAVDKNYPQSFGYSYLISTGSQNYSASNNLTIGMVKAFGDILHVSWRDTLNGGYGVDVIDNTSNPVASARWESLIFDNGMPTKLKSAMYVQVSYLALPSGATITPQYKIDRGAWTGTETFSTTSLYKNHSNFCRIDIGGKDFNEIQIGFTSTATTLTPTITSVMLVFNDTVGNRL